MGAVDRSRRSWPYPGGARRAEVVRLVWRRGLYQDTAGIPRAGISASGALALAGDPGRAGRWIIAGLGFTDTTGRRRSSGRDGRRHQLALGEGILQLERRFRVPADAVGRQRR